MQSFQQNHTLNNQEISKNNSISSQTASSNQKFSEKPSLSPFLANSLTCSDYGFVYYNQRQNLIINISQSIIVLFDATPLKEIKTHELDDWVADVSYCEEIDTYIVGCESGSIYIYNASKDELKQLKKCESYVLGVEFLGSRFDAFILSESQGIFIGNLEDEKVVSFAKEGIEPDGFHYLVKSKLLLSSFFNGSVKIFSTDKLPHLREIFSVQAHQTKTRYALHHFSIKVKEYIITSGRDERFKIWHLIKGRMRLLKVVHTTGKTADSAVYLEKYNMVAVSYETNHIDFFKLPSWKLEKEFCFNRLSQKSGLFLMKDRNMIGCVGPLGFGGPTIDFIELEKEKNENKN